MWGCSVTQLGEPGGSGPAAQDLASLAEVIGPQGLGARSRWALTAAAEAAKTEGIGGILVVRIPPKGKELVDMSFTIGKVEVISRWAG